MTQKQQVLSAVQLLGGATVRDIQTLTGISHPGTVRRELMELKYQSPTRVFKRDNKWYVSDTPLPQPEVATPTQEPDAETDSLR